MSREGTPGSSHRRDDVPRGRSTAARGVAFWLVVGLGSLLVGAYATLCFLAGDKVPPGTSVAGVSVGGLHQAAAETRLRAVLGPRAARAITVTGAGLTTQVSPAEAGLSLDIARSVRDAGGGHNLSPGRIWRYYTGGEDVDVAASVSATKLDRAAATVTKLVDKPVVEGTITFDRGRPVPGVAEDGRRVARDDARTTIRHGFLRSAAVAVPFETLRPEIDNPAVAQAMRDFAQPATSGSVELVLDGHDIVAPPDLYTKAIRLVPKGGRLEPDLSVTELLVALEPVMSTVAGTPEPATYTIEGGKPKVVPSKIGVSFDRSDLQQKFLKSVVAGKGDRRVNVKGVSAPPTFTTSDAKRMQVTEKISGFASRFGYADYRNTNLERGAALLDGTVVQPGRTFSFEETTGRPTDRSGFATGYEQVGGIFKAVQGAGLSQLASTVYNAMFDAGLEDAGHEVLSVYSDRYPLGLEASVDFGKQDMSFTNNTPYGVLIKAAVVPSSPSGDGSVTVSMYSTRTWDVSVKAGRRYAERAPQVLRKKDPTCEAAVGYPGFSVDVTRIFRKPGRPGVDHQQKTTTVYEPSPSVVCDAP